MVKIVDQSIPADMLDAYKRSLRQSTDWKPGANIYTARTRQPFKLPVIQDQPIGTPSAAQQAVRSAFKKCINCYNKSPKEGGVEPPEIGYRSREWWYTAAGPSGLWYYDYFIQQSFPYFYGAQIPDWCGAVVSCDQVSVKYQIVTAWTSYQTLDLAWAAAWTEYQNLNWQGVTVNNVLDCWGRLYNDGEWYCKARIHVSKETLVFKPKDYLTQLKWDDISTIKLMFSRFPYNPGDPAGGAIKLHETDETQAQVFDYMTFYIPKNICNYDEFSITLEGVCLTSDDLRPEDPAIYNTTAKGSNTQISNTKLYCA